MDKKSIPSNPSEKRDLGSSHTSPKPSKQIRPTSPKPPRK